MKKKIIREYIQQHPDCTYREIRKNTNLRVERIYNNLKEAYYDAGMPLSKNLKKRSKKQQKEDILQFIISHPGCSITDIQSSTRVNVMRFFKTIKNAYKDAGVEYYKKEPSEGVRSPEVINRSRNFEKLMLKRLEAFGTVISNVKTKTGKIDGLFKIGQKFYVIEIKDFRGRNNMTQSQIKQVKRYMKECSISDGILICPKESFPKRKNNRINISESGRIVIISDEELNSGEFLNFIQY